VGYSGVQTKLNEIERTHIALHEMEFGDVAKLCAEPLHSARIDLNSNNEGCAFKQKARQCASARSYLENYIVLTDLGCFYDAPRNRCIPQEVLS